MRRVTKYWACAAIASRQARRAPGELVARIVFFAVVLGVFTSLWRAVAETGTPLPADPGTLVWYLAITEWIVLSTPVVQFDIQEAVRRGDVVCQLGRPVSYVAALFAECVGTLAVRGPVLLATACACAFGYTRRLPPLADLAEVVPVGLAAAGLLAAIHIAIGLLAFWMGDVAPVSWVTQKLMFILGGLMMPLSLYPDVVQRIAPFTPFPVLLSGPATLLIGGGPGLVHVVIGLTFWATVVTVVLVLLFRRVSASLSVAGG